jgi:hypothetical protein
MRASNDLLAKMLHFPRFRWPGAAGRSLDDAITERLQAGLDPCPDASRSQQVLALVLKAAAQPGTERELSGEAAAIDAFMLATSPLRTPAERQTLKRPHARKTPVLVAAITTALVAGLCGTAVADALPAPLQRFVHSTFGAPAPGSPAPALTGPSHAGSVAPTLSVTASNPVPSTGDTGKISGQSAIPGTSGAKTPTAPTSAASSAQGNNGNGKAKGKKKSNGNGNGNGKTKSNGNGKAKGKDKGSS